MPEFHVRLRVVTAVVHRGDPAARWLADERYAGMSPAQRRSAEELLAAVRDRVLGGAAIAPGDHVVDLGAGTGLLTLAALALVGPAGTVSAVDLSREALEAIRPPGYGAGRLDRIVADAAALPLPDGSVNAVVARSVLIYLEDLPAALAETARILVDGGKLSVFEPVNSRRAHDADLSPWLTADELRTIRALFHVVTTAAQTMSRFDPSTTVLAATQGGFEGIEVVQTSVTDALTDLAAVDGYLNRPPHPGASSPLDTITAHADHGLADRYADAWHEAFTTQGTITFTTPVIYLTATRAAR